MPDVPAVSSSPTWTVPLMAGAPVAGLLEAGSGAAGVSMWNQRERSLVPAPLIALIR